MGRKRYTIITKKNIDSMLNVREFGRCDDSRNIDDMKGYLKLIVVLSVTLFILLFRGHAFNRIIVDGTSMDNTLHDSDVLIAQKFDVSSIKKNDIIILTWENKMLIKRVVGVPKDIIEITNKTLYINDCFICSDERIGIKDTKYELENNQYFVLGDNYADSVDSRFFGFVDIKDVKGLVLFRLYPFNEIGNIQAKK